MIKMDKLIVFMCLCTFFISYVNGNSSSYADGMREILSMEETAIHRRKLSRHLRDFYYSPTIRKLFADRESTEKILSSWKLTPACSKAITFAMHSTTEWSFSMFDAMAKPPASLKYLANHWTGGFEECNENQPPKNYSDNQVGPGTHYTRIAIFANVDKVQLPNGILLDYGACVPDTCTTWDVYFAGLELLKIGAKTIPILSKLTIIGVEDLPKESLPLSSAAIAMISLTSVFGFLMLFATIYDLLHVHKVWEKIRPSFRGQPEVTENDMHFVNHIPSEEEIISDQERLMQMETAEREQPRQLKIWEKLIIAFSVYTNAQKVFDTKQQSGRLNCLDGIRFLSMSWVIFGHSFFFAIYYANNLGYMYPLILKHWTYAALYNATFSVDSFFVLSGLLTAYLFLKETTRNGIARIKLWVLFFVHRYWRLTPPYLLFIGFYTSLYVYMSDGPFWNYKNGLDQSNCEKTWWHNLLYINNLYPAKDGCMGWTWYLANDMQFHYIVAPVVLIFMYFLGIFGTLATLPVILGSLIATGIIAHNDKTASIIDLNENVYFKPWCRVSSYLVGMVVGCLICEYQKRTKRLHWSVVLVGWLFAAGICLSVIYGVVGIVNGSYTVSKSVSAFYTSTSRFAWSVGVGWVIFACTAGYGGLVNSFLSWRAFIPLSRLTYCAYLVHPVIIMFIYMNSRIGLVPTTIQVVTWFCGEMVLTYLVAFALSLTWESPLLGIERVLLKKQ